MDLLRFTTAGSVDDGKSTLIGRLLYDSKAIFTDQLEAIEAISKRRGEESVNLALLTDGLRAEREQGITIDVAYRYFATPKRKFIIADTPGHIQYTRNMVTGASTANAAIVLIDARFGVVEQTIRHLFIASLLRIPHIIVCINKMDLVGYSNEIFEKITKNINGIIPKLGITDINYIPISALKGENVVNHSSNMNWYTGKTLMYLLENIEIAKDLNFSLSRFPVQYIIRPNRNEYHDYRGYAGRIAGGVFQKGDKITALSSGISSHIASIDTYDGSLDAAIVPQSIVLTLEDDIDISRGDMIVKTEDISRISQDIELMICWFIEKPLVPGGKYSIKHSTNDSLCIIKTIEFNVNIKTLQNDYTNKVVNMNDIAKIIIRTSKPLYYDLYSENRITGSLILIDPNTNETVGAGMIMK
jgi:sulfate adenylyltransferase subunit 1